MKNSPDPALIRLLDEEPQVRLHALDEVPDTEAGRYALRGSLLMDPDARVRQESARQLAKSGAVSAVPWLLEALDDPKPSVREAALIAMATLKDHVAAERVAQAALEEPVWWVRRQAVYALSVIAGTEYAHTLRAVLDDPFWRVRNAAIKSLHLLSTPAGLLQPRAEDSDRTRGALEYMRRKRAGEGGPVPPGLITGRPADESDPLRDPDPAVMTARLRDESFVVPSGVLLEMVQDAHESLRVQVVRRLEKVRDQRVLRASLIWMDEPRIPHAKDTVEGVLAKLGDDARPLVESVLNDDAQGAVIWALSWIGEVGAEDLLEPVLQRTEDVRPAVRRQALLALGALGEDRPDIFGAALEDPDGTVRLVAANALLDQGGTVHLGLLARLRYEGSARMRRVLALAASRSGTQDVLQEASTDADFYARSVALSALNMAGALEETRRTEALADPDPWIRRAVLDPEVALQHFENDPDPEVRRTAFELLRPGLRDTPELFGPVLASQDPWVVARAAGYLDPLQPAQLTALLALSSSEDPALRAAAADPLLRAGDNLEAALRASLETLTDARLIRAAYTWLFGQVEGTLDALLTERNKDTLDPSVQAHLQAMLHRYESETLKAAGVTLEVPTQAPTALVEPEVERKTAELRTLKSGVSFAPLTISGAYEPPMIAFEEAWGAGVETFFWEPRYSNLSRFLKRKVSGAKIIAGTYHASPDAITKDVDTALRLLCRDTIDVFLLFWVRSRARLSDEAFERLSALKRAGKIRAFGFSTHERKIACESIEQRDWDVVMVRHNAAHVGAESTVFPAALAKGVGVLTFSNLCYGRMLQRAAEAPTVAAPCAVDCYRYSLSQPGVSSTISAPRRLAELRQNLEALEQPGLDDESLTRLRAHGSRIYDENKGFNELVRRVPSDPVRVALLRAAMEGPKLEQ